MKTIISSFTGTKMKRSNHQDQKTLSDPAACSAPFCQTAFDPANPCCTILRSLSEGVFTIDLEKRVTFFNRAAEFITGFNTQEAVGQYCFDVFRSSVCQVNCPLEAAIASGKPVYECAAVIVNKQGRQVSISLSADLLKDQNGAVVGAVEVFRDTSVIESLRQTIANRYSLGDIISKNYRMQEIFEILPDVAESESTVLIQGPSGTGKEVLANTIHELSPRKKGPFIKINCSAIPDTLLESELFGYVVGAFTDAKKDKKGRFALADKGTLFLDEVGDTSPAMQAKLLRVLEEQHFIPLGGTTPVKVDVRIISASNRELKTLIEQGRFREDLYYRINVIGINLPPLDERREDIPLLVEHFIGKLNSLKGKDISGVSEDAMAFLMNHRYPGNIRELENVVEHAYVLCRDRFIEPGHLPPEFLSDVEKTGQGNLDLNALDSSEVDIIRRVLIKYGGNKVLAARELGIGRSTLWRKMKKYDLR